MEEFKKPSSSYGVSLNVLVGLYGRLKLVPIPVHDGTNLEMNDEEAEELNKTLILFVTEMQDDL